MMATSIAAFNLGEDDNESEDDGEKGDRQKDTNAPTQYGEDDARRRFLGMSRAAYNKHVRPNEKFDHL